MIRTQIINLRKNGKTTEEIAMAVNRSIPNVTKILFENELTHKPGHSYVLSKEEVLSSYNAGLSTQEMADKYQVSLTSIYSYLKRYTNWKPKNARISDSIRDNIKKKHFEDYQSMLSLSEEYKLSYHTVRKICYPELYKVKKGV
ncbi:hypothetical protein JK182_01195 [Acetobacter okinawensis]|uniref:hypothetical protein n=1 Tax=Acetobacter okinawensis TaxID=1076594 RepID=UPI001BA6ADF8|nr:hypothetical protein [Acetobacter okinawensis]MBS0987307.1 hypothetical protein [Acetobacter okinawensis]